VLENLESEGYSARTFSISAASIGANHKRERVWILANSKSSNRDEYEINKEHGKPEAQKIFGNRSCLSGVSSRWEVEPDVGRVADGLPDTMDRLKSLGNSVVPQIPFLIGSCIKEIENI
jgi:DNA (cytosine-5)-methyltransferase 1